MLLHNWAGAKQCHAQQPLVCIGNPPLCLGYVLPKLHYPRDFYGNKLIWDHQFGACVAHKLHSISVVPCIFLGGV